MTKRPDAAYWIDKLQLTNHVEGGVFREVYRSELIIPRKSLPLFFQGDRPASTHIYFLLLDGQFSAFHRIASDEVWHFYVGSPLVVEVIDPAGARSSILLGGDPDAGRRLHGWARQAGFTDVVASASTWVFSAPDDRAWWGDLWAERTVASSYAAHAVDGEHANPADLDRIAAAWHEWVAADTGWFSILHGEVLCRA